MSHFGHSSEIMTRYGYFTMHFACHLPEHSSASVSVPRGTCGHGTVLEGLVVPEDPGWRVRQLWWPLRARCRGRRLARHHCSGRTSHDPGIPDFTQNARLFQIYFFFFFWEGERERTYAKILKRKKHIEKTLIQSQWLSIFGPYLCLLDKRSWCRV